MLRWGSGSACSKSTRDLTQVLEYMFNIVEINCSFLVHGFEAVNINISYKIPKIDFDQLTCNIHYLESMD